MVEGVRGQPVPLPGWPPIFLFRLNDQGKEAGLERVKSIRTLDCATKIFLL